MLIGKNRYGTTVTKILRKMKLTAALLLAVCLQVSASGFSQKVTLNIKNSSLEKVFREIRKQSGFLFLYKTDDLKKVGRVNLQVNNMEVTEVLTKALATTGFSFKIIDKTIVLNATPYTPEPGAPIEIAFLNITGEVTNEKGEPLQGATVKVQGTKTIVSTNQKGAFNITTPSATATIEISFIGYTTQVVTVTDANPVKIVMKLAENILDETVVIAYGNTSKRFNTGSVGSVTSEIISNQPVGDALAALQGRISGLMITASNGMPGSSFQVRVRGENSMKQGNEPLYIIDGVPFNSSPINQFSGANGNQSPLSSINPADIERIDVLKDADATAIYGSRAANGVLLITTKKGKTGESRVNLNLYTGFSKVGNKLDMMNTEQYLQMRKDAFRLDGVTPTAANAPDLLEWSQTQYTDWQDLLIGNTARLNEAQVSFTGGTSQTKYLISGTYRKETTVLKGNSYFEKGGMFVSTDHVSTNGKFGVRASLNYTTDFNNSVPTDVSQYFYYAPNFPVYNPDGSLYFFGTGDNPLVYLNRTYETKTNNIIGNSVLRYSLLPDLDVKVNVGFNRMSMDQVQTLPAAGFNPATFTGSTSQFGNSAVSSYIVEPQVDYKLNVGKGVINLLGGMSWQQSISKGYYVLASGYSSDALLKDIMSAGTITKRAANYNQYNYSSAFGRVNYNLDNKYLLNVTFRRDGSSRFGPGKQFGNFGAIGAGWIFSKEAFIADGLPFLSFGKIRGSYGTTGNDQIGDYQYLDTWGSAAFAYDGVSGLTPTRVYNPDYSWEINRKLELALELGFLKDRILFTAGYYDNKSSNQLIGYTLSSQSGFTEYTANMPAKVQNKGLELDVITTNIQNKNFSWNTQFNISLPKNKLLQYDNLAGSADATAYQVGQSIRLIKGFHFLGVDPATGVPTFEDVDKNGSLAEGSDYVIIGETLPAFFGGFTNEFTYKGFSLNVFFQFVKQESIATDYGALVGNFGANNSNKDISYLNYWQQAGDAVSIPKPSQLTSNASYTAYRNNWRYSDAAWGDASYIRLKNVMLSYNLSALTGKWKLNSTVYVQGQNLLTFTNYRGMDPEVNGFDRRFVYPINPFGSVRAQALPVLRTITVGIKLSL